MNNKEMYYCECCKDEFWITREEASQKGSLCPSDCGRNHQILLGATPEEIAERRKMFIEDLDDAEELSIDLMQENYLEEQEGYIEEDDEFFDELQEMEMDLELDYDYYEN